MMVVIALVSNRISCSKMSIPKKRCTDSDRVPLFASVCIPGFEIEVHHACRFPSSSSWKCSDEMSKGECVDNVFHSFILNGDGADIFAIDDSSLCELQVVIESRAGTSCHTCNGQRKVGCRTILQ